MPWPLKVGIPSLGEGTEGKTGRRTVEVGGAGDVGLPPWNIAPIFPIAHHESMLAPLPAMEGTPRIQSGGEKGSPHCVDPAEEVEGRPP